MPRRIVDISVALKAGIISDPPHALPKIEYLDHHMTAPGMAKDFGISVDQLPEGEYAAIERVQISTHNGTHIDAPYHYFSRMNERLVPPGVKLDFRHFEHGYVATVADVQAELKRIGHTLKPLEIVVVNTAAGARYGEDDYIHSGCGMGKEATLWLLEQGVRVTGTDGWSWDAPFSLTKKKVQETGDASLIWEGHRAGREIGYCHMEKLTNLESLPPDGFMISCFPVKVHRGSAGWTRAVAIIEE